MTEWKRQEGEETIFRTCAWSPPGCHPVGCGLQVHVKDGDREEHAIPLDEDGTYTFSTSLGTNTIEVKGGTVNMASADCPNQDCVEQGAIDDETGMIVCMPHQLLVTVE